MIMKYIQLLLTIVLIILINTSFLLGKDAIEIEYFPVTILKGSDVLPLELAISNFSGIPVTEVKVLYRWVGENRFKMKRMDHEGSKYYAQLNVNGNSGHLMEYYFRIAYLDGGSDTYPAGAPVAPLLKTAIQTGQTYDDAIMIISPEPEEQIFTTDIVITASFSRFASMVDVEKTRLYLDTWDVSQYLLKYEDFISFAPRTVPAGRHKIRLELLDKNSNLIATREWYFTGLTSRVTEIPLNEFSVSGRFFAETRQEDLRGGDFSNAYNQSGLSLRGVYNNWQFGGRLYVSNQEKSNRQPVNRYAGFARANFWNDRYFIVDFGDAYPRLNPLILQNVLLRGVSSKLYLKFLNLEFATGKTLRAVQGENSYPGTFQRNVFAIRPSFGSGENFQLGLTYLKGKDDENSIDFGINPQENVSAGTDLFVGLDKQRIVFEGSFGASAYNRNISGGSIPFDTLETVFDDLSSSDERFYNLAKKFITVNQYLILQPGLSYQARLLLRYYKNNFSFMYESVDEDYYSLGQPYLLRDNRGFHIVDNIYLLNNQVFLSLGYRQYHNNLQDNKSNTTTNRNFNANLSYFPLGNLPEISIGYNNYSRDNGVPNSPSYEDFIKGNLSPDDSVKFISNRPEDNQTNSINFSTGYQFNLINLKHRVGLNLMSYNRTDINILVESNSNYFSLNLRTQYQFPLETVLEFILQQTESGVDTDRESKLDLTTFGLGGRYVLTNLFTTDRLFISANLRFGSVNSIYKLSNLPDYNYTRNHFTLRANYSVPKYGTLGLSGDLLTYSGDRSYNDLIYMVRYDYNF